MPEGYYYLHINGEFLYRRDIGGMASELRESDFVRAFWPVDPEDRSSAWRLLVEGLAAGARPARIHHLAARWGCDNEDAKRYAERVGAKIGMDGNAWCATRQDFVNIQESPAGFGDTALDALAALAKELGYRPAKMWGSTFEGLIKQ